MEKLFNSVIVFILSFFSTVQQEHLDFRSKISTDITKVVMSTDEVPKPPDDSNDCPCNKKTGIITHGDGHTSKCPCTNGDCGCVNKSSDTPDVVTEQECLPGGT